MKKEPTHIQDSRDAIELSSKPDIKTTGKDNDGSTVKLETQRNKIKLAKLELNKLEIQLDIAQLQCQAKLKLLDLRDHQHQRENTYKINELKKKFDFKRGQHDGLLDLERRKLKIKEKIYALNQHESSLVDSKLNNKGNNTFPEKLLAKLHSKLNNARNHYSKGKSDYVFKDYKQALFNFGIAKDNYQDIFSKKYRPAEIHFGKIQKRLSKLKNTGEYSTDTLSKLQ